MHVSDAAAAFDNILHKGENYNIYNIGAQEERTVVSVARDLCSIFNKDADCQIEYVKDRAFNDRRYFVASSKLEVLGWRQEKDWTQGLSETVEWYLASMEHLYWGEIDSALKAHPFQTIKNK